MSLPPDRLAVRLLCFVSIALCCNLAFTGSAGCQSTPASDLPAHYQQWLDQDVRWIITLEERAQFLGIVNDRDRDLFIENFWKHRDPTPDTVENEFKEEHCRRIAYSNIRFAWGSIPGWETDRGRVYITFGPPDSVRVTPVPVKNSTTRRAELWTYSLDSGDRVIRFVDSCKCGDYRLQRTGQQ